MKINDAVFGLLLLLLGGAVLWVVQGYPKIPGQQVGPAIFPGLIAFGLCVCGLLLMVRGWRDRAAMPWLHFDAWVRSPRHVAAVVVVVVGVAFYILAAEKLGFFITSTLVLAALMWALAVPPLRSLFIAVVATFVIHFAFYKLLRVPLPWGVFTPYAW
ncbi:tripartite tricarboxylate transporter TctB family protein [Variovorax rhizosphaerae]|uniref:Tripartite tricarboxylate transporter TctB family protein n=1 Tax=Variovorax rhizosphaerae TaxID=1836200 RepID=A0ABU8WUW3_9BURK